MLEKLIYELKILLRVLDVSLAYKVEKYAVAGFEISALTTHFWDESNPTFFQSDIIPYFDHIPSGKNPLVIIDAGVSSGIFSIAAAKLFPGSRVFGFEPSYRNRKLADRNLELNEVSNRVTLVPYALWNTSTELSFRSHGGMSSIQSVGSIPRDLPSMEKVSAISLDLWVNTNQIDGIDIIKMDIEGSEIEALYGAKNTLLEMHPTILLQAYHLRKGKRTFEECSTFLNDIGYKTTEVSPKSGFLIAISPDRF